MLKEQIADNLYKEALKTFPDEVRLNYPSRFDDLRESVKVKYRVMAAWVMKTFEEEI